MVYGYSGDFLQLPPVSEAHKGSSSSRPGNDNHYSAHSDVKFCFEAQAWNAVIYACVELRRVFRQRDMAFVTMLNELRVGIVTPATLRLISTSGADVDELRRV